MKKLCFASLTLSAVMSFSLYGSSIMWPFEQRMSETHPVGQITIGNQVVITPAAIAKDLPMLKSVLYYKNYTYWFADMNKRKQLVNPVRLTNPSDIIFDFILSSDNKFAFFTAVPGIDYKGPYTKTDLYLFDLFHRKAVKLTKGLLGYEDLQLSPDNKWLAYQFENGRSYAMDNQQNAVADVCVMDTKTLKQKKITLISDDYHWKWTPSSNALTTPSLVLRKDTINGKWHRSKVNWPKHVRGIKQIKGNIVTVLTGFRNSSFRYTYYLLPPKYNPNNPLKNARKWLQFKLYIGVLDSNFIQYKSKIITRGFINKRWRQIIIDLKNKTFCSLLSLKHSYKNELIAKWSKNGKYVVYTEVYDQSLKTPHPVEIMAVRVKDLPWKPIKYINHDYTPKVTAYNIASVDDIDFIQNWTEK